MRLEKRRTKSHYISILVPILSILASILVGAVFIKITGYSPIKVYFKMLNGAFGSSHAISQTIVKAVPLMLAGLGISIAFRMLLWNIGAEGQIYMGAFAASGIALFMPDLPVYIMLPLMFTAGFLGGAFWGFLSALPRALLGVNETITTLLLNYVAILWVDYLVYGPWKDPEGFNFPLTAVFSESAKLPTFGNSRVHIGIMIAVILALMIYIILMYTKWGYEIRIIGESQDAAKYAGINISRNIILVMLLSGGLAGLAGMVEVSGITHRLQPGISTGYGYTAIIIAWLSKLNPFVIILVSILFGGLLVGGYSIQTMGLPASTVFMLQGLILFFVLGGEIFTSYRIKFNKRGRS